MKKSEQIPGSSPEWTILRGAIENTNEGFVTIDQNHRVIIFNKAAEKIFGFSREEVLGKDLALILSPECTRDHRRAVARFLKERTPRLIGHQTEFMGTRKNGERFPLSISFSLSEIEDQIFFTGLIRDLTETKILEEQVAKSERLAAVGQLVAEITHEIKNPLIMIGGFAQQLARTIQDEKSRSKLKIISDEIQRLEELIMELREIYRPPDHTFEPIDLKAMLQDIYSLSKENFESRQVRLKLEMSPSPLLVKGDPVKLKQVLLNLINNAVEAMEEGGVLEIQGRHVEDKVRIIIADNGPGIPPEDQKKLFTPFFTTKRKGTGLGLIVSKKIIEDHPGGSLDLESEAGKGTTVRITLPFSPGGKDNGV
jgi:PAS domain S-box-containing protein